MLSHFFRFPKAANIIPIFNCHLLTFILGSRPNLSYSRKEWFDPSRKTRSTQGAGYPCGRFSLIASIYPYNHFFLPPPDRIYSLWTVKVWPLITKCIQYENSVSNYWNVFFLIWGSFTRNQNL